MNLILLYGPPAVGKFPIAKILKQKTSYKLLHNHLLQNPISEVFPFDNPANIDDPRLRQSVEKQLNKLESSNKFAKAVFYGNNQEFQQET